MLYEVITALAVAHEIGFPVVMRPSYVLGGRDMRIVYNEQGIRDFMAIPGMSGGEHPVLLDQFLKDAIEVDVDAVCVITSYSIHYTKLYDVE